MWGVRWSSLPLLTLCVGRQVELRRAPDGGSLRQWRRGPVKVDPLAPLQAIERYLVIRGYGRTSGRSSRWSEDSGSEEDSEDALVSTEE